MFCLLVNQNEINSTTKIEQLENKRQHIVLVDDDIITGKIHQTLIKSEHSEKQIISFDKPGAAFEYIKSNRPDLILLDLHMPEIDGLSFLKMLNDYPILVDVIVVSSSLDAGERLMARSYNFVKDFITKPLTQEEVRGIFNI